MTHMDPKFLGLPRQDGMSVSEMKEGASVCTNKSRQPLLSLKGFPGDTVGEGNGNQLQYSCLENPRDRGAWWAAIYQADKSQTEVAHSQGSHRVRQD